MIYKIGNKTDEKELIMSFEINNKGDFTLIAETGNNRQYKIFSLKKDGVGHLFSYIGDETGLKLNSNGKLIIEDE